MAVLIVTAPGTPVHLDADCPECGWADLWQIPLHSLTERGVGTIAVATWCLRCRRQVTDPTA
jgi:hypothetical protein